MEGNNSLLYQRVIPDFYTIIFVMAVSNKKSRPASSRPNSKKTILTVNLNLNLHPLSRPGVIYLNL